MWEYQYDEYYSEISSFLERIPNFDYETEEEIARIIRGRKIQR